MTLYGIEFDGCIRYVGITKQQPGRRLSEHWKAVKNGSEWPLHRAMRKYGRPRCRMVLLASTETYSILLEVEKAAIRSYGTRAKKGKCGLNLTDGGEGTVGFIQPQHVRDAVAESNRRRAGKPLHSEEFKRRMSERLRGHKYGLGHKHTPEFKAAMSARLMGNKFGVGFKHSEEAKAKIAAAGRTPERAAFLRSLPRPVIFGRKHSVDEKERISASLRATHERHRAECCNGRFHSRRATVH